ncbi:hypothetical protein CRG98_011355 [Punica granatum]|uniref:Uncharacterized protein n=1 Tax=Punica granatum TaxID=22663 RepID=A0A2I0KIC4_PUNGR|nr:hypothetical protein CRG98_011355 [Punica granatum]
MTLKDTLDCAGGCARLHEERCARLSDDVWLRWISEKLALLRKVDRSSGHGSPCHGGRMKVVVGLPAKETLSRRGQEAEQGVPYQDDRKIRRGLVNMNDILIFENCMMHVCEERTVLSMHGGPRLKGVNSSKSSKNLWGPNRWHSRLDPFPYSEPLTNLASYFGARGISDEECSPFRGRATDPREKESPLTVYDP